MRASLTTAARILLAVLLAEVLLVWPFTIAADGGSSQSRAAIGMALSMGLLCGFCGGTRPSAWLAAIATGVVGVAGAFVVGVSPANGTAVILPPVQALACGFLVVSRARPVRRWWHVLAVCFVCGAALAIGVYPALGLFGFVSSIGIAGVSLVYVELWRLAKLRRSGESLRPWLLLPSLLWAAFAIWEGHRRTCKELPNVDPGLLLFGGVFVLLLLPATVFLSSMAAARWFERRVNLLRELGEYLRVLSLPLGAFAIGFVVIVILFAGLFGVLHHVDGASFQFATAEPTRGVGTWLFLSFFIATSQTLVDVVPQTTMAKFAVGAEMLLCVCWAVVVFAAVMAHAGPLLQRIADRRSQTSAAPNERLDVNP